MKVVPETYLMKVVPETYLMKVVPVTYLMKGVPETYSVHSNIFYVFIQQYILHFVCQFIFFSLF
jgi:hypothetical protein